MEQIEDQGVDPQMWADVLYRQAIHHIPEESADAEQLEAVFRLFEKIFVDWTDRSGLHFNTLFARMAWLFASESVPTAWVIRSHRFRKVVPKLISSTSDEQALSWWTWYGLYLTAQLIRELTGTSVPPSLASDDFDWKDEGDRRAAFKEFIRNKRVWARRIDAEEKLLYVITENRPAEEIAVVYEHDKINDLFSSQVESLDWAELFPLNMHLHNVVCTEDGKWYPRALVIEPDFLIDVTAIAECFSSSGVHPISYLSRKFNPVPTNKYLLAGQAANVFLDALMNDPDQSFDDLFSRLFQINPLGFASMSDGELKEIMDKCRVHYSSLRQVVKKRFPQMGIDPTKAYLEPSFSAPAYGIQGRLDVLHSDVNGGRNRTDIVELKSGQTYRANKYRINRNHYVQTLLYDLLIDSTELSDTERKAFVLYSIEEQDPLRYAPAARALQWEAIAVRNQLLLYEKALARDVPTATALMQQLSVKKHPALKGFLRSDLHRFEQAYDKLSDRERSYFDSFVHFVAREHYLAKVGHHGRNRRSGSAGLWLNDMQDKEAQFNVLKKLTLSDNFSDESDPFLIFSRTTETNRLANFREGDIVVLYPHGEDAIPTDRQIFKCTITDLDHRRVQVRLRSPQRNQDLFQRHQYWNIEHDILDSSFNALYKSLFSFAEAPRAKRELILTERPPKRPNRQYKPRGKGMTEEQQKILDRMINAEEYFLLWGPPGTGKTRIILSQAVDFLFRQTDERMLLIAYTNRAVDEMCDALIELDSSYKDHLIRIGSRFGTAEHLRSLLLRNQTSQVETRRELRELLRSRRIYLGTVSSMLGASDLWELITFDRMVVDEASQVLEPALAGLLHRTSRFILIGDHRQLPAVVTQTGEETRIEGEKLNAIGLIDRARALFERMYKRARDMNWTWAYGQLSHQGRMHEEIMRFPSREFYSDLLDILPSQIMHSRRQQETYWNEDLIDRDPPWLFEQRNIFISSPVDWSASGMKSNRYEAKLVRWLVVRLAEAFHYKEGGFHRNRIGVITPYRAQIARIRESMSDQQEILGNISVDTVERYQGSARDVIILSLCTNEMFQFKTIAHIDEDGLDRRLNVALTRAREQVIVIGNEEILNAFPQYRRYIQAAFRPQKTEYPSPID